MPIFMNKQVPSELVQSVQRNTRAGAKLFFVVPDGPDDYEILKRIEGGDVHGVTCKNCNGSQSIGLQKVVGGPWDSPVKTGRPGPNERPKCIINHEGNWYLAQTKLWPCPVCAPKF